MSRSSSPSTLTITMPPDRLEAVSTLSVSRRATSSRITSRSTTISMECLRFLSSLISSVRSYREPSARTRT